jgi:ketol-acid reductoisomerase
MREGISGTALFGDLTRGPRVIGPETRRELGRILEEIRSGDFAREWSEEAATGRPRIQAGLDAGSRHPIEAARLRALAGPDSPLSDPGRGEPRGA